MGRVAALFLLAVAVNVVSCDDQKIQVVAPGENIKTGELEEIPVQCWSIEAQEVKTLLLQYITDVDITLKRYVEELKETNDAATALKQYQKRKDSITGTKCAEMDSEEDRFNGAEGSIQVIVETCAAAAPQDDRDALKKEVMDKLAIVHKADLQLKKIAEECTSLGTEPSVECEEKRTKQINIIKSCTTHKSLAHITYYFRNAFFNTKNNINSCVSEGTKDLKDNLDEWNKKFTECKNSSN